MKSIAKYRHWLSSLPPTPGQCAMKGFVSLVAGFVLFAGSAWIFLEAYQDTMSASRLVHLVLVLLMGTGLTLLLHAGFFFLVATTLLASKKTR